MKFLLLNLHRWLNRIIETPPRFADNLLLWLFAILITLQPYFTYGKINLFELGIYLPGIQAFLDGALPYRDFFHLRGPLEIYVPAFFMRLFGESIPMLYLYFYIGTIFTLILGITIAKNLYQSRLVLYMMAVVFVARTFPRVVFHIWGGMRYTLGLLVLLWLIYYYKQNKRFWMVLAGVTSALAFLTSAEIGVCAIAAVGGTILFSTLFRIQPLKTNLTAALDYTLGIFAVALPYGIYLTATGSLAAYWDATYSVATNMTNVFSDELLGDDHPQTLGQAILGMMPWSDHFKHMTVVYTYLFFAGYLAFRLGQARRNQCPFETNELGVVAVAAYGFVMYVLAFRKLGAAQFEMALQPDKILLFFMVGKTLTFFWDKQKNYLEQRSREAAIERKKINWKLAGIYFLIFGFVGSSLGNSIHKYNHRFFAFWIVRDTIAGKDTSKLAPLADEPHVRLSWNRVRGMVVPQAQARDFELLIHFLNRHSAPEEKIFMFPELGSHHFIVDRPFIGKFPMATFAWINQQWHDEFFAELKTHPPRFVVVDKNPGTSLSAEGYFKVESNRENYEEVENWIAENYEATSETPSLRIYKINPPSPYPAGRR